MITYFNKKPTKIETKMIFETKKAWQKKLETKKAWQKKLETKKAKLFLSGFFCFKLFLSGFFCFKLFLSGRYFCVFVLVFVNALFKVCLKIVSPFVKTVFLYGKNHAFDNVLAVVKVGPQSKMGLWDNIVSKDFFIKLWRNKLKVCRDKKSFAFFVELLQFVKNTILLFIKYRKVF